jgi:peptide/nickel transport system substrate-binding protein
MDRRTFLATTGTTAGLLSSPFKLAAQTPNVTFRWVPSTDLSVLDPVFTTAAITACHAMQVFDTLFGLDAQYQPQPQMLERFVVSEDLRQWTLNLRPALRFHDGSPVVAQDVIASLKRFGQRNLLGQTLFSLVTEIVASDATTLKISLNRPFSLLPYTLASTSASIMPEHLANTPDNVAIKEMVGSGPFRFLPEQWVSGSKVEYAKASDYVPRVEGIASNTAGPKIAYINSLKWLIIPDRATAVAALQNNEVDGIELVDNDFIPMLRKNPRIELIKSALPSIFIMRFNHLHAPFNNVEMRRAILSVIRQSEFMMAANGADFPEYWNAQCGVFAPGTPMASEAGMEKLNGKRDMGRARKRIQEAGYKGETIVILDPVDAAPYHACALVTEDLFKQLGLKTELRTMNWGTYLQRRNNQEPPKGGGWSVAFTALTGTSNLDPASNLGMRGTGKQGWFGWPTNPTLEALRMDWFFADTLQARQKICRAIQVEVLDQVPYIPLGANYNLSAIRKNWQHFQAQGPVFYTVRST